MFEGKDRVPKSIVGLATNFIPRYRVANSSICRAAMSQAHFVATLFENIRSIGVGVVVRNAEGSILVAIYKKFKILAEPSSAEAIVALVAIDFLIESPFRKII